MFQVFLGEQMEDRNACSENEVRNQMQENSWIDIQVNEQMERKKNRKYEANIY